MAEQKQLWIVTLLIMIFFPIGSNGEALTMSLGVRCLILDKVIDNVYFPCVLEGTSASVAARICRRQDVQRKKGKCKIILHVHNHIKSQYEIKYSKYFRCHLKSLTC